MCQQLVCHSPPSFSHQSIANFRGTRGSVPTPREQARARGQHPGASPGERGVSRGSGQAREDQPGEGVQPGGGGSPGSGAGRPPVIPGRVFVGGNLGSQRGTIVLHGGERFSFYYSNIEYKGGSELKLQIPNLQIAI